MQPKRDRTAELATESPSRLLARYSLPAIVGMTVMSTYNLVDALFVGQGAGTTALAALTTAFPVQMLYMAIAQTVGMGAASIISRALGAGDREKAISVAGTAFVLVTALGLVSTILGLVMLDWLLTLFGARGEVLALGHSYLLIVLPASIFFCFSVAANSLIRSEGNQRTSMTSLLIGGIVNLILDPIFIFGFDMGIEGAAWATFVGQTSSFIYQVVYFRSSHTLLRVQWHHLRVRLDWVKEIFSVGSSAFARTVASSIFSIVVNNSITFYGDEEHLAVFGICMRVLMLMLMPIFGLVQALQPIVGFNYGAQDFRRVSKALKAGLVWATVWSLVCFGAFELFAVPIMAAFDPNPEVHESGAPIFRMVVLGAPVIGFQVVAASFFQHIGKAGPALFLSLCRQVLFLIPLLLLLPLLWGLDGLWIAFPVTDLFSSAVTAAWLIWAVRHLREGGPPKPLDMTPME